MNELETLFQAFIISGQLGGKNMKDCILLHCPRSKEASFETATAVTSNKINGLSLDSVATCEITGLKEGIPAYPTRVHSGN